MPTKKDVPDEDVEIDDEEEAGETETDGEELIGLKQLAKFVPTKAELEKIKQQDQQKIKKGEGLAALQQFVQQRREFQQLKGAVQSLPVDKIRPWPGQPRKFFDPKEIRDLGRSINGQGQKVPIVVTADPERPGCYLLVDGERRWRAHKLIQRKIIQGIVRPQMTEKERFLDSLISNFGRKGHTPYEIGAAIKRAREKYGLSITDIAEAFAKSDCWVYQHLSLTKLDTRVISMMEPSVPVKSRLKFATALLLTGLPAPLQYEIAKKITDEKMGNKAAGLYAEARALEAGFKIGKIGRPERRRRTLINMMTVLAECLPAYLNAPDISLHDFLAGFPPDLLANLGAKSEDGFRGVDILCKAIEAVRTEAKEKRERALKPKPKKKNK